MKISTSKILLWHTFKRTTLILNELSMAITEDAGNFAAVSCYQININCVFGQRKRESERERQKKTAGVTFWDWRDSVFCFILYRFPRTSEWCSSLVLHSTTLWNNVWCWSSVSLVCLQRLEASVESTHLIVLKIHKKEAKNMITTISREFTNAKMIQWKKLSA